MLLHVLNDARTGNKLFTVYCLESLFATLGQCTGNRSVVHPLHFCMDPDRIRNNDFLILIRIQILLFLSVTFKMLTKNIFFASFLRFF
jgi:hypothetical protein